MNINFFFPITLSIQRVHESRDDVGTMNPERFTFCCLNQRREVT